MMTENSQCGYGCNYFYCENCKERYLSTIEPTYENMRNTTEEERLKHNAPIITIYDKPTSMTDEKKEGLSLEEIMAYYSRPCTDEDGYIWVEGRISHARLERVIRPSLWSRIKCLLSK